MTSDNTTPDLTREMRLAAWMSQYLDAGASCLEASELALKKVNDEKQRIQDENAFRAMMNARAEVPQPVTDAERQQALIDIKNGLVSLQLEERDCYQLGFSAEGLRLSNIGSQIGAALIKLERALSPSTVDFDALKISAIELPEPEYRSGYNAAIDHIASEYDLVKKVK